MEVLDLGFRLFLLVPSCDDFLASLSCAAIRAAIFLVRRDRNLSRFFSASMYLKKSDFLADLRQSRYSDSRRLATIALISDLIILYKKYRKCQSQIYI